MHTQIDRFFKNFFEKIHALTCLKWETILGGVFLKNFLKNKRTPLNSSNREENVGEKILNCKLYNINFPKFKIC